MHILVGLVAVLALLYFWLIGHWFARVLMFLVLIPLAWAGICVAMGSPPWGPVDVLILFVAGLVAWPVSGLPEYYWRRRARLFTVAGQAY